MKRFRLAAWATLVGLGLASGCSSLGGGSSGGSNDGFFSRMFHRNRCDVGCPCDIGCGGLGGCCGPTCDGGPMVMDPWSGAVPPGAMGGFAPGALTPQPGPGALAPQTGVPPLAPTPGPFTAPVPQAQPLPAGPVSRAK
jgi:hypothetical protein